MVRGSSGCDGASSAAGTFGVARAATPRPAVRPRGWLLVGPSRRRAAEPAWVAASWRRGGSRAGPHPSPPTPPAPAPPATPSARRKPAVDPGRRRRSRVAPVARRLQTPRTRPEPASFSVRRCPRPRRSLPCTRRRPPPTRQPSRRLTSRRRRPATGAPAPPNRGLWCPTRSPCPPARAAGAARSAPVRPTNPRPRRRSRPGPPSDRPPPRGSCRQLPAP